MFTLFFFLLVLFIYTIATLVVTPKTNKMFSSIWSEEEHPLIKRETQERLNELFVDGDVPAETGLIMAAKEQNVEEEELLAMLGAINASDLKRIVKSKGAARVMDLYKVLDAASKIGMRHRG